MLLTDTLTENVSTIHDNKVVIPEGIQKILGVSDGYRVMFIPDGEEVRVVNPAVHAMRKLQEAMKGAAERAGLYTEDDVVALVKEVRAELAEERASKNNESVHRHEYSDFLRHMA
ncbi:MAG: hypothetical protein IJ697_09250 [Synergistaceae bacterium]|nr:hypothetical protein [Synergistaceae bacterium]